MDSDERDDVSLARLLRKGLFSNVEPFGTAAPVTLVHSQESSLSDEIFIPMSGHPPVTNVEVSQSGHSSRGGNFDDPANQNPADVDTHVEPTDTCTPDNVEPDVNVEPQPKTQQSPGTSRPKGKKF
ncbi:uncharacterized protein E5676_scaffold115G00350 [Cucumis melo var. makuwa]|uniref:Envelope-like protein n=1 Tax=Cucumis melo var. makuwa TaxID=1194695 RepID=A0A5D3DHK8_CUCMM|nr:uncharacterized protein E6C27_scaffold581G00400 [Cucumis melo var. makuwa]TYK22850.1 uncharacterized protein E5676_scaffold115G00350 [Cucumis melo var. makuwa]